MNKNNLMLKNFLIWVVAFSVMLMLFDFFGGSQLSSGRMAFSEFLNQVDSGQIAEVTIRGDLVEGKTIDGKRFATLAPSYPNLVDRLSAKSIRIEVAPVESVMGTFFGIILSWFPLLLLMGVWIFFMKQMQGGAGKAMGFGKSKAKMLSEKQNNITFGDVAGVDEAKEELKEIVDFLRDPQKYQRLGGKIPKGCLLIGSPGTGKTLLAKAIAGEAKVPFFTISGSDFVEMFVGVGASRVRDMFEQAKKHSPCIIFIDEIDAVGRHRGAGLGGGNDEREQTLNQLLVEMDGFATNQGVIVIAATNRPDVLDPALLRPGRFDRQIVVPVPDINGREQVLKVHASKVALGPDVDLRVIARGTPGFSGADLSNLINESALLAARRNRNIITMQELEEAKDKVMMGVERKSMVMKDEEKLLTAYHEGGHALTTVHMQASDPIHKATIIPRGRALGMVMRLPEEDRFSVTREKLHADLVVAMGGRAAEELIFGYDKVTTGASSDIDMATNMAHKMVTQWGMSDIIGPIRVSDKQDEVFLGHTIGRENKRSESLNATIDAEVKRIVNEAHDYARKILKENVDQLHLIAKSLIKYETLSGDEINQLLKTGSISRPQDDAYNVEEVYSSIQTKVAPKKVTRTRKKPSNESEEK